mmetsp:Transcript_13256/g.40737  ORF Transcript_13256/g.40737 Transcript_13256/m.40737 type:complete len:222 (+) Transcript_13256:184-849(+)
MVVLAFQSAFAATAWKPASSFVTCTRRAHGVFGSKPVRVGKVAQGHVRRCTVASALHNRKPSRPQLLQRFISSLLYLVPFLDVIVFGEFVFRKIPLLQTLLLKPMTPLLMIYRGIPFVAFAAFLFVYFFIGKNPRFSYFVRYNAHQAVLLDMTILIPQLLLMFTANLPPFLEEAVSNAVFYAMTAAVGYSLSRIVRGILPREIPFVSDAVEYQLGPNFGED